MSTDPLRQAITAAVLRILRPLVRILLRSGISYGTFADWAKAVYVDVAEREFTLPGRKQTISRVAILTGLTRKEVARLQGLGAPEDQAAERHYNRAARVVAGWVRDERFQDATGAPAPLPLEGEQGFGVLVRSYSGDVTPRAVLDELLRVGMAELDGTGRIRLRARAYVPQSGAADKLHILGTDVAFLIDTIDHNLQHATQAPRFQRKVAYDNLPEEAVARFRVLSAEQAQRLIEDMDRWLAAHDRDVNPAVQGRGRKQAGIGIYYFERNVPEEQ